MQTVAAPAPVASSATAELKEDRAPSSPRAPAGKDAEESRLFRYANGHKERTEARRELQVQTRASELECMESGSAERLWKTIGAEKAVLALGVAVAEESFEQHMREAAKHRKETAAIVLQFAVRR